MSSSGKLVTVLTSRLCFAHSWSAQVTTLTLCTVPHRRTSPQRMSRLWTVPSHSNLTTSWMMRTLTSTRMRSICRRSQLLKRTHSSPSLSTLSKPPSQSMRTNKTPVQQRLNSRPSSKRSQSTMTSPTSCPKTRTAALVSTLGL